MREIEREPRAAGAAGTVGIWALFVLLGFLLPLLPRREYKTIQIRLDAPAHTTSKSEQAAPPKAGERADYVQTASAASAAE